MTVRWGDETANTNVVGIAPAGFLIRNFEVASGRIFSEEEDRARMRVAVLGPTVVKNLFGDSEYPCENGRQAARSHRACSSINYLPATGMFQTTHGIIPMSRDG